MSVHPKSDLVAMARAGIIGPTTDEYTANMVLWYKVAADPLVHERMEAKAGPHSIPGTNYVVAKWIPEGALGRVLNEMTPAERAALRDRIVGVLEMPKPAAAPTA